MEHRLPPRTARVLILLIFVMAVIGCTPVPPPEATPSPASVTPDTPRAAPTRTPPQNTATHTPLPSTHTPAPSATASATPVQICSPLAGYELDQLADLVVNPFAPPVRPGSDDPHQGVDLAILSGEARLALPGEEVRALLPGVVASVTAERFPYGNAVLIETAWELLPGSVIAVLPTLAPSPEYQAPLNCPPEAAPSYDPQSPRALYVLYAHLLTAPQLEIGQRIECGQPLGQIGASGNALNPHLHLELRQGPSGARFPPLAHYEPRASDVEMAAYCAWRIQGDFQLVDPALLLWEAGAEPGPLLATPPVTGS